MNWRVTLLILFCSVGVLLPARAFCFDTNIAHPSIAELAAREFDRAIKDVQLSVEDINCIKKGASEEDVPTRWYNHFYDPVYNRGIWFGAQYPTTISWVTGPILQIKYSLGDQSWQRALDYYQKGDRKNAMVALGHAIHLLSDMAVPAHTRNDIHPAGDSLEQYVKDNWKKISPNLEYSFQNISDLNSAFYNLAKYSNGNFYSDDTIESKYYQIISTKNGNRLVSNGHKYIIKVDNINRLVFAIEDIAWQDNNSVTVNLNAILFSYSTRLVSAAISNSAGLIDLFFREAAKNEKQNLSALKINLDGVVNTVWGYLVTGAEKLFGSSPSDFTANILRQVDTTMTTLGQTAQGQGAGEINSATPPLPPVVAYGGNDSSFATAIPSSNPIAIPTTRVVPDIIKEPILLPTTTPPVATSSTVIVPYYGGGGSSASLPSSGGGWDEQGNVSTTTTSTVSVLAMPVLDEQFKEVIYTTSSDWLITGTCSSDTVKIIVDASSSPIAEFFIASSSLFEYEPVLNSGHNYFYFVAVDIDGVTSTQSLPAHLVLDNDSPPVPSVVVSNDVGSTELSINLSSIDELSPLTYFDLFYRLDINSSSAWQEIAINTTTTEFSLSGERGSGYYFRARARDGLGNTSAWSDETASSTLSYIDWSKEIVINEVAWAGAAGYADDEWLELYNNTNEDIILATTSASSSWRVTVGDRTIKWSKINNGVIPAHGYYLLERTDDDSVQEITGDIIYTLQYGFNNAGEKIALFNPQGEKVDEVDCSSSSGWFAGDDSSFRSMERNGADQRGSDASNWHSSLGLRMLGRNHSAYLNASPRQPNYGFIVLRGNQAAETYVLNPSNNPYILGGYTVPVGKKLIIEEGVVVKNAYYSSAFKINGDLEINGSGARPVILTSGYDQSFDQSSYNTIVGTWSTSTAFAGDWQGIQFYAGSTGNISNLEMRYAGHLFRPPGAGTWTPYVSQPIRADEAVLSISNSVFSNNLGTMIYVKNTTTTVRSATMKGGERGFESYKSAVDISDSSFSDFINSPDACCRGAILIADILPKFSNLSFSNNTVDRAYIDSTVLSQPEYTITKEMADKSIFSYIFVSPSSTLYIDPGAEIKMTSQSSWDINGVLTARGEAENPISFSPFYDDQKWNQLSFDGSSSTLRYVNLEKGNSRPTSQPGGGDNGMILAKDSNLEMMNVNLLNPRRPLYTVQGNNSTISMTNCEIKDDEKYYNQYIPTFGVKMIGGELNLDSVSIQNIYGGLLGNSGATLHLYNMSGDSFVNVDKLIDWPGWIGFDLPI
ncbi:MAG: lamin tail domain-containing protein [Candidatus Magasanikbacteria bacterium]